MNGENKMKWCNRLGALLMGLMLLCQFMPFWSPENSEEVSINGYVWFPSYHEELKEYLLAQDAEHYINHVVWPTIGLMLLCAAGVVFCLWKSDSVGVCLLPTAGGILGTWFYLATPVMRLGEFWWIHLLLCILMLLAGIGGMLAQRKTA